MPPTDACTIKNNKKMVGSGGGEGRVGLGGGGVRVDVIEELKFLGKFTQKKSGGGSVWGGGGVGGGGGGGFRMDVNEELKFL